MKTQEFIEAIRQIENQYGDTPLKAVEVDYYRDELHVTCIKEKHTLARVSESDVGDFAIYGISSPIVGREGLTKGNLVEVANLIYHYSFTEIEEREEEKKYRYSLKGVREGSSYLNYNKKYQNYCFTNLLEVSDVTTQFTDSETKNFPEEIKNLLKYCEKIEVK